MMYTGTVFHHDLDEAMELLAEVVLRPVMSEEEVQEQRDNIAWEHVCTFLHNTATFFTREYHWCYHAVPLRMTDNS
jgi:hypothetical protein